MRARLGRLFLTSLLLFPSSLVACSETDPGSTADPSPSASASASGASEEPDAAEKGRVRTVFEAYRSTVLDGDGAGFSRIVAQPTLDHYEALRDLALTASKKDLAKRPVQDQAHALFLRSVFEPKALASLDGHAIARAFVEEGVIGEGGVDGVSAGEIEVSGSVASVQAVIEGQSTFAYTFRLEEDEWRIDLVTLAEGAEIAFRQQMAQYGLSEREYVLKLVEVYTGTRPTAQLFEPPRE